LSIHQREPRVSEGGEEGEAEKGRVGMYQRELWVSEGGDEGRRRGTLRQRKGGLVCTGAHRAGEAGEGACDYYRWRNSNMAAGY